MVAESVLRRPGLLLSSLVGAGALALALGGCRVEQTREGEMPDVEVSASAGQIPKYRIEKTQEGQLPDVDVQVEAGQLPEFEVETPDIEVKRKTVEVPYPGIDIQMPAEDQAEGLAQAIRQKGESE